MDEKENLDAPVITVSGRDWQRMVKAGFALLRLQNDIVGVAEPTGPVGFRRGATDGEILEAWGGRDG